MLLLVEGRAAVKRGKCSEEQAGFDTHMNSLSEWRAAVIPR
jgi:hypothetical protein